MANQPPGTPRWVKIFGVIAIVVVVLIVIMHLTGNSFAHHTPSVDYWLQQ